MFFRKPIEEGVAAGMKSAFREGGPFTKALDAALAPTFAELKRLRRFERRHQWHPMEKCPEWLKDGRPVLVNRDGDFVWAAYFEGDDGSPGYWDGDIEHGGEPLDPQPSHFFIVPEVVAAREGTRVAAGQLREEPLPNPPPPAPGGEA